VLLVQLDWASKAAQITEMPSKPDAIYIPGLPILDLFPTTMSLPFFESEVSWPLWASTHL
jgi:hypothetical protein